MIEGLDTTRRFHAVGTDEGIAVWYVDTLWEAAAELSPEDVPITSLDVMDCEPWFAGVAPTFGQVMEHLRRIHRVEMRHPIVLGSDGRVMDGLHRVARAMLQGRPRISAVRFEVDPEPDLRAPWPDGGPRQALARQVRSWSDGDLDGYLAAVHPQVLYQRGDLVIHGREALRAHYGGRVHGVLEARVLREQVSGDVAVMAVEATLGDWSGRALLTWVRTQAGWQMIADSTQG